MELRNAAYCSTSYSKLVADLAIKGILGDFGGN